MPLFCASAVTVVLTVILFCLEEKTKFGKTNPIFNQIIIGILFGCSAIFATEIGGITIEGAVVNVRDAAPVCAGLIFGPWAGVVSGLIGGIERFFAAYHNVGVYTQLACTIGTFFSGCFAAVCKATMFKKLRPTVLHTAVIVLLCEVVHMAFVPLTHLNDLPQAIQTTYSCFLPLVVSNTCTVIVSAAIVSILFQKFKGYTFKEIFTKKDIFFSHDLFFSFQFWLLCIIVFSFAVTVIFSATLNDKMFFENTQEECMDEIKYIEAIIANQAKDDPDKTREIAINNVNEWTVGTDESIENLILVDTEGNIISSRNNYPDIPKLTEGQPEYTLFCADCENINTKQTLSYYIVYSEYYEYKIIAFFPEKTAMYLPHLSTAIIVFTQMIVFSLMMLSVFLLLKKLVGKSLNKINRSLDKITHGDFEERVNVYDHIEFAKLSDSINSTVDTLKKYIEEEANRYNEEFELAHQIQQSALPQIFPPYPDRQEFDIYATYKPARVVGGDFYDFYLINDHKLVFLIADVSGKGIPAAMFMMRAKTALKAFAYQEDDPAKILEVVNNYLCENNEAGMFVTAWLGIFDTKTGKVNYASAGHNPPVSMKVNGKTEFLENKPGLVLAGMSGMKYKTCVYAMQEGETLFLYTDGITEANNKDQKLYGGDRLLNTIDQDRAENSKELIEDVKKDIDIFADGTEQFDDITMFALQYFGNKKAEILSGKHDKEFEITVESRRENLLKITEAVERNLKKAGAATKNIFTINVALDEIYSNIVKYGYGNDRQFVTVKVEIDEKEFSPGEKPRKYIKLVFIDSAERFNPLEQAAPDITLSAKERKVGGLGIFMVRNMIDEMSYEYKNRTNRLTLIKYLDKE